MKKLLFTAIIMALVSTQVVASTTKAGYVACGEKEFLENYIRFLVEKDDASIRAYISSWKCFSMKGGMVATVTDSPGMFGGKVGFIVDGVKLWSLRESLNY